jgi:hypothetical protein
MFDAVGVLGMAQGIAMQNERKQIEAAKFMINTQQLFPIQPALIQASWLGITL